MLTISWLAEIQLASQGGNYSLELISCQSYKEEFKVYSTLFFILLIMFPYVIRTDCVCVSVCVWVCECVSVCVSVCVCVCVSVSECMCV